ncbi:hypothetical protein HanIR_Chr02g0063791 [Helianthus annuus]|nr:hypothetical protein HanIR_Chr02g0063791 [Helianthus annuus]
MQMAETSNKLNNYTTGLPCGIIEFWHLKLEVLCCNMYFSCVIIPHGFGSTI